MVEPHRIPYDLMPAITATLMYVVLIFFAIALFYGVYRRFRVWRAGKPEGVWDNVWVRLGRLVKNALGQRKVVKRTYPGVMHLLIYAGMVTLFIGTTIVFFDIDIFIAFFRTQILRGNFYLLFEYVLDIFGVFAVVGLLVAIYRRAVSRPANLPSSWDDVYILSILLVICVTGFIMEGLRLAIDKPEWARFSPVGYRLALLFVRAGLVGLPGTYIYQGLWWFHAILAFAGVASIPYTKLFHLITSPLNAFFSPLRSPGELSTPFDLRQLMESGSFDIKVGASGIDDFSWKQRLSFDSCTVCGRCSNACPATASGTLLSPMHLILKLRDHMFDAFSKPNGGKALHGGVIDSEELWACTACRACVSECPVLIEHIDSIVEMRRHLVAEGKLDRKKRDLLTNLTNVANPYGMPPTERAKWAEGLGVPTVQQGGDFEMVYWVGCAGSYDPRNQNVSRAMVKILRAGRVKFGILGNEEKCNCEVARRVGEEGRFQQGALELIEILKKYGVRKIVTQCPHCFNTFKNEYPKFGADFEVVHHSQLIAQLIRDGRLNLRKGLDRVVTFHDPCYLGRFNDVYVPPREVISSLSPKRLVEMERCRENSFCCGGGGGNFWYTVELKKKASVIRMEEAQKLNPDVVGAACPFCISMFEDAVNVLNVADKTVVRDVAELVAEMLET